MKYYVIADPHAYFKEMKQALTEKGYFNDTGPKKLIICGDLFDRGKQIRQLQDFVLDLIKKDEIILIRGNHEDLMLDLVHKIKSYLPCPESSHHGLNGTYDTAIYMSGMKRREIEQFPEIFTREMKKSPFLKDIIPKMVDYYETEHYIFVHGWIPCYAQKYRRGESTYYKLSSSWRKASPTEWNEARWHNGMAAAKCGVLEEGKTIVCGHFRTCWGHSIIHGDGDTYGPKGNYKPYYNDGIIALDGCTAFSRLVNCIVIED